MTLDYSIIAFNALNSLVLMTIPIQHFDCFVNSFSRPARAVNYFSYTTPQKQKGNKRDQPSGDKNNYVDPIQLKHD